VFYLII
jgi:cAMP-dependent protein kinase regulator